MNNQDRVYMSVSPNEQMGLLLNRREDVLERYKREVARFIPNKNATGFLPCNLDIDTNELCRHANFVHSLFSELQVIQVEIDSIKNKNSGHGC